MIGDLLSLYMGLVGYGVMVGIPVISSAWSEKLGYTAEQVGRVAGADMGGLSLGAVVVAHHIEDEQKAFGCLRFYYHFANYLCTVFEQYEIVLWLRVISGFGNGIYTGVAVAALGATIKPVRAFNLFLFAFAFSQALEIGGASTAIYEWHILVLYNQHFNQSHLYKMDCSLWA